eukprot:12702061-Alexandrium_andersonii.AAC.1
MPPRGPHCRPGRREDPHLGGESRGLPPHHPHHGQLHFQQHPGGKGPAARCQWCGAPEERPPPRARRRR